MGDVRQDVVDGAAHFLFKGFLDGKGGIQGYEMSEAKIDGDKAEVETTITYGNGDTKKQEFQLVKTASGDWKLDAGK